MSLCGHEGMRRERTRPAPVPVCLCTFCDLELFRGWLARAKALAGPRVKRRAGKQKECERQALLEEVWDSMIQRNEMGIGMVLAEVAGSLYGDDCEVAADALEALADDEEMLQASLDPADKFRGCPSKPLAATPLFDAGGAA